MLEREATDITAVGVGVPLAVVVLFVVVTIWIEGRYLRSIRDGRPVVRRLIEGATRPANWAQRLVHYGPAAAMICGAGAIFGSGIATGFKHGGNARTPPEMLLIIPAGAILFMFGLLVVFNVGGGGDQAVEKTAHHAHWLSRGRFSIPSDRRNRISFGLIWTWIGVVWLGAGIGVAVGALK